MSDKKAKIVYGCMLVVILVAVSVFSVFPFRSSKTLTISFVGLTNSQYFGPVSTFCASNTCDQAVSMLYYAPQTKIHGAWVKPKEQFLDIDGYLEPHQSVQFVVPTVTNQTPWRVMAEWHYEKAPEVKTSWIQALWARVISIVPASWLGVFKTKRVIPTEDTMGSVYDSYSQEMKND